MTSSPFADPALTYAGQIAERIVRTEQMAAFAKGKRLRYLREWIANDHEELATWGKNHGRDFSTVLDSMVA